MKEYIATVLGAGIVGFLAFLNLNPQPLHHTRTRTHTSFTKATRYSATAISQPGKRHRIQCK
jgi:hypothetical protein